MTTVEQWQSGTRVPGVPPWDGTGFPFPFDENGEPVWPEAPARLGAPTFGANPTPQAAYVNVTVTVSGEAPSDPVHLWVDDPEAGWTDLGEMESLPLGQGRYGMDLGSYFPPIPLGQQSVRITFEARSGEDVSPSSELEITLFMLSFGDPYIQSRTEYYLVNVTYPYSADAPTVEVSYDNGATWVSLPVNGGNVAWQGRGDPPFPGDPSEELIVLTRATQAQYDPAVYQSVTIEGSLTLPPEAAVLTITEPTDGATGLDPMTPVRGTGAPSGATVDLYVDSHDSGNTAVSSVTAAADGSFEFIGSTPFEVSPEGIAVGVGADRSAKITVEFALVAGDPDEGWTVAELKQFAADHYPPIPIPSTANKAEILAIIVAYLRAGDLESWTHAQIDAWADAQKPVVDYPRDANKADKVAAVNAYLEEKS